MTVAGARFNSRAEAATALRNALARLPPDRENAAGRPAQVASVAEFDVVATARQFLEPHLTLELADVPRSSIRVDYDELRVDRPLGIVVKLENKASDLDRTLHKIAETERSITAEADRARAQYGQPFPHREALNTARARSAELAAELGVSLATERIWSLCSSSTRWVGVNRKGCRGSNRTRLVAFAILWLGAPYDWLAFRQACQISGRRRPRSVTCSPASRAQARTSLVDGSGA